MRIFAKIIFKLIDQYLRIFAKIIFKLIVQIHKKTIVARTVTLKMKAMNWRVNLEMSAYGDHLIKLIILLSILEKMK